MVSLLLSGFVCFLLCFILHFFIGFMYLYVGLDPQEEEQGEKVSTLGAVRKDTTLLLKGFRQGVSNWIHSLLDQNTASAGVCMCFILPFMG